MGVLDSQCARLRLDFSRRTVKEIAVPRAQVASFDLRRSLEASCDTYFYYLARDAGIDRLAAWARAFGLGSPTGIELGGENPGLVPDDAWSRKVRGQPWYGGETISVGIGLFIMFIGLSEAGIVVKGSGTPLTLGSLTGVPVFVAVLVVLALEMIYNGLAGRV